MARTEQQKPTVQKRSKSRIPRFKTIEEAAEFWDSHSLADFEDELEVVDDAKFVVLRGCPKKAISIRLPEDTLTTITKEAQELGVGPSSLIRMWILERLREKARG